MDCRRRSPSCCHPKLVPFFNENGKLVPTSHRWGHQDGHVIGKCTKPRETSRGYVSSNCSGIRVTAEKDSGPQPLFFLNLARFQLNVGGRPAFAQRTTAPHRCPNLCTRLASSLAMSAFPRASPPGTVPSAQSSLGYTRNGSISQLRDVLRGEMSFGAPWSAAVARRGSAERVRAAASRSIWRS
jgi:hypothetical protein